MAVALAHEGTRECLGMHPFDGSELGLPTNLQLTFEESMEKKQISEIFILYYIRFLFLPVNHIQIDEFFHPVSWVHHPVCSTVSLQIGASFTIFGNVKQDFILCIAYSPTKFCLFWWCSPSNFSKDHVKILW